jgi:hypothetical protein
MISNAFGMEFDALRPGSAADLIVMDYQSPTPLSSENLAGHFLFGLHSAAVEGVIVGGRFIIKERRYPIDERSILQIARKQAGSCGLGCRRCEIVSLESGVAGLRLRRSVTALG